MWCYFFEKDDDGFFFQLGAMRHAKKEKNTSDKKKMKTTNSIKFDDQIFYCTHHSDSKTSLCSFNKLTGINTPEYHVVIRPSIM